MIEIMDRVVSVDFIPALNSKEMSSLMPDLFSEDRDAGPDNSIFRTGSTPGKTRTVAIWAVNLPPKGSPEIYLRILNPNEDEKVFRLNVADVFAGRKTVVEKIISSNQ